MFTWFRDVFAFCWQIWSIEFEFGGFSFTLANVAEVAVFVWVLNRIIDSVLVNDD